MKYYAVVRVTIRDDSWVREYLAPVTALVHKHGGKYLARTMTMEHVEVEIDLPTVFVILEWPSKEAAQAFYADPEYQPYRQKRLAGARNDFVLVAGEDIAGL
jgi:uncharacterized protein (DUF1330 family)